jgi:predicted enzyme related to lactoylglutathione lyase
MSKTIQNLTLAATAAAALASSPHEQEKSSAPHVERVASITVLVKDQDEALRWYTEALGFEKRADDATTMAGFRWLTVGPRGMPGFELVLLPATPEQLVLVGKATTTVLTTRDCKRAAAELKARGVEFTGEVRELPWGVAADLVDLYGNPYHLLQASD